MVQSGLKTFMAKTGEVPQDWYLVDATDKVLGRLAVRIAMILQGKHRPTYTPHIDTGEFVVVVNAEKIKVTGRKAEQKKYFRYSGYPGGLREIPFETMIERKPEEVLRLAVRRMLPKTKLGRKMIKKLKIYSGPEHPHEAQAPKVLEV
jgi:large subunit ribosomal protein L13